MTQKVEHEVRFDFFFLLINYSEIEFFFSKTVIVYDVKMVY